MKWMTKLLILFFITGGMMLMTELTFGEPEAEFDDKTLSPYFFVKSDDPELDQLPLKSTTAEVNIAGVIADVTVTQVYKNEGKKPLEAIYIFPASTRAAVYGMKMTIGKRTIIAQIKKREEARKDYEQAKKEGKSASLLEQQRPNVFQMNVANILPSDVITVELKYTELLVPTDSIYEFVYPTVTGPRYAGESPKNASPHEQWIENPYLHEGEASPYAFDITVNLSSGLPIQEITCTSHKVTITYNGKSQAQVKLDPQEKSEGNKDYIVRYRLSGGKIDSGLLLYEGGKENFFLAMVHPPRRVTEKDIPGREYIFIVDVSGSMHGFPLNISKQLLKDLISNLRQTDMFNVLLFAGGSSAMSDHSLPATKQNINQAITTIENQRGGGGTQLLAALQRALALPRTEKYSRTVVIVTDGYVSVEEEAFDIIRKNLGNANMFAFGIGSSVNRFIIEGMARVGMGEPFVITKPAEAPHIANKFRELIQSPVLTNIKTNFRNFNVYDVEPPSIPDVLAQRPVIIFGKWRGKPQVIINIQGITVKRLYTEELRVDKVKPLKSNKALMYLWARHRIALLSDYNKLRANNERINEVTNLGLTYNLLTAYTSFVAIDSEVRLKDGKATTVKQPLPLPEGVSDYAVGSRQMVKTLAPAPYSDGILSMAREKRRNKGTSETPEEYDSLDETLSNEEPKKEETEKKDSPHEQSPVQIEKITVSETLSHEAVKKALHNHLSLIQTCSKEATRTYKLKGKMVFLLELSAQGHVVHVQVQDSEIKDRAFVECIIKKLKNIRFMSPRDGKKADLTFTLTINL
jgi:Ca-activated chloride channel family protein